jgi:hypothetical protein
MQVPNNAGELIEVFTAEELNGKIAESVSAKESEYAPKLSELEKLNSELSDAKKALGDRASEFRQFRKLSDEAVSKLSLAEKTIYENGVILHEEREKRSDLEKKLYDGQVDSIIRTKVGSDEKLFTKMKEMWGVVNVEAQTPEQIEYKAKMILGAIGTTEPDLVASLGGFSGGHIPPVAQKEEKGFADTDKGKALANELGLAI